MPPTMVNHPSYRKGLLHLLLALFVSCCVGCGEASGPVAEEQTRLSWLGTMYGMYIGAHRGRPPQKIDDLRSFVAERTSAEELSRLKVNSVDELFVSPRDGKSFEMVKYQKMPEPAGGEPSPIVLYEAAGDGGERAVAFLGGNTRVVSENELKQMLPAGALPR